MPELAEVEAVRRHLQKKLIGRKIKEVHFEEGDRFLFAFAPAEEVQRALEGAKIIGTGRKGKYFWLKLNRKPWPIFHLGMSGNIALQEPQSKSGHRKIWGGAKLWSAGEKNEEGRDRLWFCRLLLWLDKGYEVAFTDPRRFGRIWLTDDPPNHPRIRRLGYDPLIDFPTAPTLGKVLGRRKKSIKTMLLDQTLFAGIGNWLADEILYQARISPHRLASSLSASELKRLHTQALRVVKRASAVDADYERFPKTWIFHVRWGKMKNAKTSHGKIIHEDIGGRTTAWVPGWQK